MVESWRGRCGTTALRVVPRRSPDGDHRCSAVRAPVPGTAALICPLPHAGRDRVHRGLPQRACRGLDVAPVPRRRLRRLPGTCAGGGRRYPHRPRHRLSRPRPDQRQPRPAHAGVAGGATVARRGLHRGDLRDRQAGAPGSGPRRARRLRRGVAGEHLLVAHLPGDARAAGGADSVQADRRDRPLSAVRASPSRCCGASATGCRISRGGCSARRSSRPSSPSSGSRSTTARRPGPT